MRQDSKAPNSKLQTQKQKFHTQIPAYIQRSIFLVYLQVSPLLSLLLVCYTLHGIILSSIIGILYVLRINRINPPPRILYSVSRIRNFQKKYDNPFFTNMQNAECKIHTIQ